MIHKMVPVFLWYIRTEDQFNGSLFMTVIHSVHTVIHSVQNTEVGVLKRGIFRKIDLLPPFEQPGPTKSTH